MVLAKNVAENPANDDVGRLESSDVFSEIVPGAAVKLNGLDLIGTPRNVATTEYESAIVAVHSAVKVES